jgi:hypothetical protein
VTISYNINGAANQTINVAANATATLPAATATAGSFAYNLVSVAYQSIPNCPNTITGTATVVVRPTPTATISGDVTVCRNGALPNISFSNPQSLPVTVTYNINGGTNTTVNVAANATATVAAPTTAAGNFAYNLVSVVYQTAPTCSNALTGTATVVVRPTPVPTISGTTAVCQNAASPNVTFTNPQALPVTVTYNINGGASQTINVAASTTATLPAPTTVAGAFTYNLVSAVYQTAPTCSNALTGSITITVRPTPTATISGNTTVCQNGAQPNISFTNPQNLPVTVTYNINGGANQTINVNASASAALPAPTTAAGSFAYNLVSVAYQAAPTCSNVIAGTATVVVRPTPVPTISGAATVCQDAASPNITFTNPQALPITISYNINGLTPGTIDVAASSTATLPAPTNVAGAFTYNMVSVVYQSAPTCVNALTSNVTVTVRPTPTATISGNNTVCQNAASPNVTFTNPQALPVTITYNINGGLPANINVAANSSATLPSSTLTAGSFAYNLVSVAYQTIPNCPNTITGTATIVVRPTPTATISGDATVCQNDSQPNISFTNPQALPVTVTYNINGGANTTVNIAANASANVPAPTTTAGNFAYNLVSVAYQSIPNCPNVISGTATVVVRPTPVPTISGTTTVCQNAASPNVIFSNPHALPVTVTYNINGGANQTINVAASTTAALPAPTTAAGTFTYNLVSAVYQTLPACPNVLTGTVTITVRPTPTASISGNATVCQNALNPNVTFTNPQNLAVTITYNINGGGSATINVLANASAAVSAPTAISGTFAYNLVSVAYQDAPNCPNAIAGTATVNVTETVATPVFTLGAASNRCQAAAAITYDATATNTSGITYSLDLTSLAAGNSINSASGQVTYTLAWHGTSIITASAAGCNGPATALHTVTTNPLPVTSAITGESIICETAENKVYQVFNTPGSTYVWTVPASLIIKSPAGLNFIIVDAVAGAALPGDKITVTETFTSTSCVGVPVEFPIIVTPISPGVNVSGPADVCLGDAGVVFSVPDNAGSSYSWTVPPGASITSDPGKHSITVSFGLALMGQQVSVFETTSGVCTQVHNPLTVNIHPLPTVYNLTAPAYYCSGTTGVTVTLNSSQLNVNYQLYKNGLAEGAPQAGIGAAITWADQTAGTYTVEAVSSISPFCSVLMNGSPSVVENLPLFITNVAVSEPLCFGVSNGSIVITASGGYPPITSLSYSINGGTSFQTSNTFAGLGSGNYDIVVKDSRNCSVSEPTLTINQPTELSISSLTVTNPISCFGFTNGSARVVVSGGTPIAGSYSYQWYFDSGLTSPMPGQTSDEATGLSAATYWVKVSDLNGCFKSASITLTQPTALTLSNSGNVNLTCNGLNTAVTFTAGGGTGSYTFITDSNTTGGLIDVSGSPLAVFNSAGAGAITLRVRDDNNCEISSSLTITQPDILAATVSPTDVTCFAAGNGQIVISSPSGGFGSYGYSIDNGANWQGSGTFLNLIPGTYNVWIRDAVNTACMINLDNNVVIDQPLVLAAALNSTNITCFGGGDGTITISAPLGGHGNYEYSINGGGSWQASGNYTMLSPGSYNVVIRDKDYPACFITLNPSLTLTQPLLLSGGIVRTQITCNGADNGIIEITAPSGGSGTYEFTSDGGASWQALPLFTGLAPGIYDVRIRDIANTACSVILNTGVVITEPALLSATVNKTDISCFAANNGIINITNPLGGYGTYQYSINGGTDWFDSGNFTGLIPNTYDVRIRDKVQTACVIQLDGGLVVTAPDELDAAVAHTDVSCFNGANGTITISSPTGGYGTYQYSINGGASWTGIGTFTNLVPNTYNLRIRDAANPACVKVLPVVEITQPAILTANVASTNTSCFGTNDGSITISAPAGGYGTYEYSIDGGVNWSASGNFTALAPGFYTVLIRDAAFTDCMRILNGSLIISQPQILSAFISGSNLTCNTITDGSINIIFPSGGYGTYEYSIDGGVNWQASGSFTGLDAGFYNVQIRDAANTACAIVLNASYELTKPDLLMADHVFTDVTCFNGANGTITISNASGGYGAYQYTINGGTSWQAFGLFTNLAPGNYNVRIRDAIYNGCSQTLINPLTIIQPDILDGEY